MGIEVVDGVLEEIRVGMEVYRYILMKFNISKN